MTPTGYTGDALVEQPAIQLLGELGWETYNGLNQLDHGVNRYSKLKSEHNIIWRIDK